MARESITIDAHTIGLSHLDKILFPEEGITKEEFIEYYERIADIMLPHLQGRPVTLERFPDGIYAERFFQKQIPGYFPEWIDRVTVELREGGALTQLTCEHKDTLIYLANQVSVPHVWLSKAGRPEYPDRLVFDLDPSDEAFEPVRYAALVLRELLRETGLDSFVMTTGSRGFHVAVPLDGSADFNTVNTFAQDIADVLIRLEPDFFTTEFRLEERGARMFIDTRRNIYGQTVIAPYAVRALPGAPVATPLEWSELRDSSLGARRYTIRNIFGLLEQRGDAWAVVRGKSFSIEKPRRRLKRI